MFCLDENAVGEVANNLRSIVEAAVANGQISGDSVSYIDAWSCVVNHNDMPVLEYRESLKPGGIF